MAAITFLAPHWLWGLALVPLLWLVRSRVRVPGHAWLRALAIAALFVGLARPALWTGDGREHAVFVVDSSESVAPQTREQVLASLQDMRKAMPAETIATLIEVGASGANDPRGFERAERISAAGSPLSAALAAAARAIPLGARGSVTLASDGLATDGGWADPLGALQERRIPVHVVALANAPRAARIASIAEARPLRAGHTGEIVVTVAGDAPDARVRLQSGANEIASADIELREGRGEAVLAWEPDAPGFVALEAIVEAAGERSSVAHTFAVQSPLRALYLGQRVQGSAARISELVGRGVQLESWQPTDASAELALERYDLVVLDDLPSEALGAERQRELSRAVTERGLGLFACGGEAAFGPGGYGDSALAEILPVECVQKEEKRDPSTTLVVIIDTSGSMGGERIQLAKEVARLAMARLLPHDKVGIVEFYGAKRWAAPIQPASNSIDLQRAINRMDAGGGTIILPAIEEAFYGMQNVQTRYKHVLVLTDGGVENGAFEPLLRRMADEGITVSTVLIGPEAHSEFLVNIANWGKGRFYSVPDRFNLPEVLLKQPTSSRLPAYKPGDFALSARGGSGWWGSVARNEVPHVAGYVETSARPGAETLLEIAGEGDPLLASWHYGLGRVTTFTSEPAGPGTQSWREWNGYGALLARVLARTADDGRPAFEFELSRRGDELQLLAKRRRPGPERPSARVVDDVGANPRELAFVERADGVFRARWSASRDAEQRVLAGVEGADAGDERRLCSNAREGQSDELSVDPLASLDLARVAAATGGEPVPLAQLATFRPRSSEASPERLRELAPLAWAFALLTYLFELFHRRRDVRGATRA